MLLTNRSGDDYRNSVGGVDLRWRINDQHSVLAQVLRSDTRYPDEVAEEFDQPTGDFTGNGMSVEYEYDARNWFAYLRHEELDAEFRGGLNRSTGGS